MSATFNDDALDWLGHAIGAAGRGLDIEPMAGSTSSSLYLIKDTHGLALRQFVLRVLDNREWLADEPDLAHHEATALAEAQRAGLPAPGLVAYSGDDVGFGAPVVLMTFLAGKIELHPADFSSWLAELADQCAAIHRHSADAFPWRFRSWVNRAALTPPGWSAVSDVWQRAIDVWLAGAPETRAVFIHRDYHPTNVLWQGGTSGGAISGVVDWINACRGPAGVDVAHCRNNLAQMYGPETADRFLDAYLAAAEGFVYDPYWDIDSLLDMSYPEPTFYEPWEHFGLKRIAPEETMRRIDAYLERVMGRL